MTARTARTTLAREIWLFGLFVRLCAAAGSAILSVCSAAIACGNCDDALWLCGAAVVADAC